MSGLNYGYKYTIRKNILKNKPVGVGYADKIKKWIVRIYKNNTKQVITIAKFDKKLDAEIYYDQLAKEDTHE